MKSTLTLLTSLLLTASGLHAQGGSLTPPPGAPASVMRTLDEIFNKAAAVETQNTSQTTQITTIETQVGQLQNRTPINTLPGNASAKHVISVPGHYYLTGGITGTSTKSGLRVDAQNVTIDLNGFTLEAVAGCTKGIEIYSAGPVHIRNGTLRWWPQQAIWSSSTAEVAVVDVMIQNTQHSAIDLTGTAHIERVTVKNAAYNGIKCSGTEPSTIRDSRVETITGEDSKGIYAPYALITRCTVANVSGASTANQPSNAVTGIWAEGGAAQSCVVKSITQAGAADCQGIYARQALDSVVLSVQNTGPEDAIGIKAETVSRCSIDSITSTNISTGILWADTAESCDVKNISSTLYANGISARSATRCHVRYISGLGATSVLGIGGSNISHCVVETVTPLGTGISGKQVTHNTITEVGTGIFIGSHSLARDNSIRAFDYGIRTDPNSSIISNTIEGNSLSSGTGIYYGNASASIRIEDNHVSSWQTGIYAPVGLVRRNSTGHCTTPYNISAGMVVVPITALGTNPNANTSL